MALLLVLCVGLVAWSLLEKVIVPITVLNEPLQLKGIIIAYRALHVAHATAQCICNIWALTAFAQNLIEMFQTWPIPCQSPINIARNQSVVIGVSSVILTLVFSSSKNRWRNMQGWHIGYRLYRLSRLSAFF